MIISEDKKLLSVKQYADLKGISVQAVYQAVWRNTIEFTKIGNTTLIKV